MAYVLSLAGIKDTLEPIILCKNEISNFDSGNNVFVLTLIISVHIIINENKLHNRTISKRAISHHE
ncbi:hypothetical protein U9M48_025849 [Paspalum notatum var. saurae]|uniref:Uncharacterized protein n=1 Tax=Paspalum notatum var. saurae TaxID=547442 RepID=A0AAQ3TTF2_PASNO